MTAHPNRHPAHPHPATPSSAPLTPAEIVDLGRDTPGDAPRNPDLDPPLRGIHVVSIAINLPGPAAVARLVALGATATTVLPPGGDPLQSFSTEWFDELHAGQEVVTLDLKLDADRARLDELLSAADVLVTSHRPSALRRLGLDSATVHAAHPRLCQVDIVGEAGERAEIAGHDLTYQAQVGLVQPPALPASLFSDLGGAERAATEACAALVARATTGVGVRREVALADVAHAFAAPVRHGVTGPGTVLGGAHPPYAVYAASDGHIALAALEPHFLTRTIEALGLDTNAGVPSAEVMAAAFAGKSVAEWLALAEEHDLPLAEVG